MHAGDFFNIQACQQDNITDLPAPPTVSFDVQTTSSPNYLLLVDQTPGTFLHKWDLGNGAKADSSVVEAYYPYAGTYTVTLQSFNAGGFGTATKEVTIGQDDPDACFGNIKLLTSCSTKTWVLEPAAGALKVGPDADFTTVWYQTGEADVAVRSCMFNDEYSFSIDGTFQYDNKGDFGQTLIIPAMLHLLIWDVLQVVNPPLHGLRNTTIGTLTSIVSQ